MKLNNHKILNSGANSTIGGELAKRFRLKNNQIITEGRISVLLNNTFSAIAEFSSG